MKTNNTSYFDIENYYVDNKSYCLTFLDRACRHGKRALYTKYGEQKGGQLLELIKADYETLLGKVPYVGEIDIMKRQMLLTVIFTAIYRTLKETEKIEDIWTLCNEFNRETLTNMPKLVRWFLKKSTFSKRMKNSFKNLAQEHKEKNLADQWDFVEGDGKTFDYGMNMTKCAKVIFLEKIGISEFTPYVCLIDKNFADCCNYGLKRTMVLAEGAVHCDFRLSKNGPVDVASSVTL